MVAWMMATEICQREYQSYNENFFTPFFNLSNQQWMDSIYSTCKQDKILQPTTERTKLQNKKMSEIWEYLDLC